MYSAVTGECPPPRVFLCANGCPTEPRMMYAEQQTMDIFLRAAGLLLGVQSSRCFTRSGGELEDVSLVMHNEVLFISGGEDFLPCRKADAESLVASCHILLQRELLRLHTPPTNYEWDSTARPSTRAADTNSVVGRGAAAEDIVELSAAAARYDEADQLEQNTSNWPTLVRSPDAPLPPEHTHQVTPPQKYAPSFGANVGRRSATSNRRGRQTAALEPEPERDPESTLQPCNLTAEDEDDILRVLLSREQSLMFIFNFYVKHQAPIIPVQGRTPTAGQRLQGQTTRKSSTQSKSYRRKLETRQEMRFDTLVKCASHFELFPSLVSRKALRQIFDSAASATTGLLYSEFLDALLMVATTRLQSKVWNARFPTLPSKLRALLDVIMKLGPYSAPTKKSIDGEQHEQISVLHLAKRMELARSSVR